MQWLDECQNHWAVNSFEGKKGGLPTLIRVVTAHVFVFTLFCKIHDILYMKCFMEELESLLYIIFSLRKYDFRGLWSATLKNEWAVKENSRADNPEKWGQYSLAVGRPSKRQCPPGVRPMYMIITFSSAR